jgi:hypothetical protein
MTASTVDPSHADRLLGVKEAVLSTARCGVSGLVAADPVCASDGHVYERHEIERVLRSAAARGRPALSPVTGEALDTTLITATYAKRVVEKAVASGLVEGRQLRALRRATARS